MSLLFSFFGRCGRGGFWLGVLMSMVVAAVFLAVAYFVFGPQVAMLNADGTPAVTPEQLQAPGLKVIPNIPSIAISAVGYLIAIWIGLATQVKRCHDRGGSGWWIILMNIVPFWALISLGILEGQEGPNKYGADPRDAVKA